MSLNDNKINLANVEKLIRGDRLPDTLAEEVFILGYKHGLSGDIFMLLMFQLKDSFDTPEFDVYVYKMLLLGYAMGQKTFKDVEEASINQINQMNDKPAITQ